MNALSADITSFERMRPELEAMHDHRWVLFHDGRFVDVFDEFDQAAMEAIDRFDNAPCLIRQVGAPQKVQLTAGMIFTHAHG